MIKLELLNKYAKELYFQIVISFKPTFPSLNINDEVENFALSKSLVLTTEEQSKLLKQTKKLLNKYVESRKQKGSYSKFEFSSSDDDFIIGTNNRNNFWRFER